MHQQIGLVVRRQFLHDVGEAFVVERHGQFVAALLRQFAHGVGHIGGSHAFVLQKEVSDALTGE